MQQHLQRFSDRARRVLSLAQQEAERMQRGFIGPEHLLIGMMREEGGAAGRVLHDLGLETQRVQGTIERLSDAPRVSSTAKLELAQNTRRVLELSVDEARRLGHPQINTEHMLLALVRQGEGVAVETLRQLGISAEQIRQNLRALPSQAEEASPERKVYHLALLGFGNVGRALAKLLHDKRAELREKYGIEYVVTGIAARRLGWIADPNGLDIPAVLAGAGPAGTAWEASNVRDWLRAARADVLFENTSMNPQTGQPAIDYLKAGLEHGAHIVTANKGPVVHAYHELKALAEAKGVQFRHEATVMGGAPIFSLFREALPATNLKRFRGLLNSTTNLILTEMENGLSFDAAVKKAQDIGIAETDPSADVDGWDAAVKVSALATVLMDVPVKPQAVAPVGIRALTGEQVRAARAEGRPFKLVCQAERADGKVIASVRPQQVETNDVLANINGTSSLIVFEMDTIYGLSVSEIGGDAVTTAYGPLADFISIARNNQ